MSTYKKDSPRFDGLNFTAWKSCMECHIQCMGYQYWNITSTKYVPPRNGPTTIDEVRGVENNL